MQITRRSMFSGQVRTIDLPITPDQLTAWERGELIQNCMPHLSSAQREFLISGSTEEEWQHVFGGEDDERGDSTG